MGRKKVLWKEKEIQAEEPHEKIEVRVYSDVVEITDTEITSEGRAELGSLVLYLSEWEKVKNYIEEVRNKK